MAIVELDLGEQIHAVVLDLGNGTHITEWSLGGGSQDTSLDLGEYATPLQSGSSGPVLPSWLTHAWEADSLALADGDPVSSWVDSIAGVTLAQTTPSKRPTYDATNIAVTADNVDTVMASAFNAPQYSFVCVVYRSNAVNLSALASTRYVVCWSDGGVASNGLMMASTSRYYAFSGSNAIGTWPASPNGTHLYAASFNGASTKIYQDSATPIATQNAGSNVADAGMFLFTNPAGSVASMAIGIHAIYLCDTLPTTVQLDELVAYSQTKWGTP